MWRAPASWLRLRRGYRRCAGSSWCSRETRTCRYGEVGLLVPAVLLRRLRYAYDIEVGLLGLGARRRTITEGAVLPGGRNRIGGGPGPSDGRHGPVSVRVPRRH